MCAKLPSYHWGMFVRILVAATLAMMPAAAQKAPFTAEAMMKLKRISDPSVAPDGSAVVYTVGEVDLEKNAIDRQVWISPLAGGSARKVTSEGRNWGARASARTRSESLSCPRAAVRRRCG